MTKKYKILLLTIHESNSYGGMLQAFAAKKYLSNFGTVTIANFAPVYLRNHLRILRKVEEWRDFLRISKGIVHLWRTISIQRKFRRFQSRYLIDRDDELNEKELRIISNDYDFIGVGSDQVWNPKVTKENSLIYFLNFLTNAKKFSISASCGSHEFVESERRKISEFLKEFELITTRETDTLKNITISDFTLKNTELTVDPTLLIPAEEYHNLSLKTDDALQERGIFYLLAPHTIRRSTLKKLRSKYTCATTLITQKAGINTSYDEVSRNLGIEEFLAYIIHAKYVVTDSFHGLIFALIFKKPFIVLRPEIGTNRLSNLLKQLNLIDHLHDEFDDKSVEQLDNRHWLNKQSSYDELLKLTQSSKKTFEIFFKNAK